ncbi:MAG: lysophospholipid acyltransferase family protein [Alphaproteobacteria bacterium]|nr:lysophospholipid acyltransferase family protein [Alphaproteobacteria bacterium]
MAQTIAATAKSSKITALFRAFLYISLTLVLIPVQAVALLLRLPLSRRLPMWYHRLCCRLLGIRLEVFGRRSRARPTLFVANHASYLDIAIYGALIPGSFVAKSEVAKWPLFGLLAKLQNSVFVDRRVRTSHLQASDIGRRLEARDSIILFPEGTSGDGNKVLPFKSALFAVAEMRPQDQPLVVQPVSLTYSRLDGIPIGRHLRPFFAWYGDMELISHARRFIGLGRLTVTVSFHDPVTIEEFQSRKDLAAHCYATVARGHADALAGRLQPQVGAAGRWDWIRWRRHPRLRDLRGRRRAPGIKVRPKLRRRRLDSRRSKA